jgi:PKD repeat protein
MLYKKGISSLAFACALVFTLFSAPVVAQSEVALEKLSAKAQNRPLPSLKAAANKARNQSYRPGPPREVVNFRGEGAPDLSAGSNLPDAVLQLSEGAGATAVGAGFDGASNNDNGAAFGFLIAPPDTNGEVGTNHFVQMINLLTTIYFKDGSVAEASFPSSAFWSGIGGNCQAYNQGDPIVLYDDQADRWVVSQFAFPDNLNSFSQCVAVSQTPDPTGAYHRYEFSFDNIGFNDYPKHGIVDNSITMIANLFRKRGPRFTFNGTYLGVMDKAAMYTGAPASLLGFNIGTGEFGFVAGDLDGPGSSPALFATAMSTGGAFDIWKIDVDWSTENASVSQIASIPITPYDADFCSASREACIPQPGGGPSLEALADRLMHRLQIRDFGSYRTMIASHAVDVGSGRAGVRWYEMREQTGTWFLYQEGTYGPNDGENRWMPSAAMNAAGDIGIGYLLSSTNTHVSTAVAGQDAADSGSGFLDSAEQVCGPGSGVQLDVNRAGDYSTTSIDPVTDSFWHTNERFVNTGQYQWSTYICEFTVASDGGNNDPNASFSYGCTGLACSFDGNGSSDSDGSISAYDWDFGDGATDSGSTASHTFAAGGTFSVVLTVTDDLGATGSDTQSVTVVDPNANVAPTANFTSSCTDLACDFTDASTDSDGTVTGWSWDFGDGNSSTAQNPSNSYASGGTYSVTLTATDNDGDSDSASQDVTVSVAGAITLSTNGFKVRGRQSVDLTWSNATGTNVDVYRDGNRIATTANDGAYNDDIGARGGATYVYQVCNEGSSDCSNTSTVIF